MLIEYLTIRILTGDPILVRVFESKAKILAELHRLSFPRSIEIS